MGNVFAKEPTRVGWGYGLHQAVQILKRGNTLEYFGVAHYFYLDVDFEDRGVQNSTGLESWLWQCTG